MKIIWAIDPFSEEHAPYLAMSQLLGSLGDAQTTLMPVYVGGPGEAPLRLTFDFDAATRKEGFQRQVLKQALKENGVKVPDTHIHVLSERKFSLKASADRLVAFAKHEKADLIAVFSHSKGRVRRFMLGSFSETLVHRSSVSVLVLNPTCEIPKRFKTIFWASDLSRKSYHALPHILKLMPRPDAKFILYHAAGGPLPADVAPMVLVPDISEDARARYLRDIEGALFKAVKLASGYGFKLQTLWDEDTAQVPDLILRNARKANADVIAVAAQAGPVRALFLGSVTRELLRTSPVPVLVVRS